MNSLENNSSPTFKNLKKSSRNSPIELKEKLRRKYKDKVQNCRDTLLTRFRGAIEESDLHSTLTEIYRDLFNFSDTSVNEEEVEVLEEIKQELVQEEVDWWLLEYDKTQIEMDWSTLEQEDNVICPICQRKDLTIQNSNLLCQQCNYSIKTQKSLMEVKKAILNSLENHSSVCNHKFQFTFMPELDDSHIYLICSGCTEMQIVI